MIRHGRTLRLEIVTPQAIVFSEDVEMVTLPAVEGEIGVYPQHLRLITQLVPGEIIVHKDGQDRFLAVGEGLVEVTPETVSIATDMAIPSDKIDEAKVEEARQRAEARLRKDLRRGSRLRQRLARARAGAAPGQAAAQSQVTRNKAQVPSPRNSGRTSGETEFHGRAVRGCRPRHRPTSLHSRSSEASSDQRPGLGLCSGTTQAAMPTCGH